MLTTKAADDAFELCQNLIVLDHLGDAGSAAESSLNVRPSPTRGAVPSKIACPWRIPTSSEFDASCDVDTMAGMCDCLVLRPATGD